MIINVANLQKQITDVYYKAYNKKLDAQKINITILGHSKQIEMQKLWFSSAIDYNHETLCWIRFIPSYCLLDALNYYAEDEDPEEVSETYRQHVDFTKESLKPDLKQWLDEDEDEAITEVLTPIYFQHINMNNTDCIITIE